MSEGDRIYWLVINKREFLARIILKREAHTLSKKYKRESEAVRYNNREISSGIKFR